MGGVALGPRADQFLDRASQLQVRARPTAEQEAVELLIEALEASGTVAVQSAGPDRRFDLGVWADDLGAIAANPLLIEVKLALRPGATQQALAALDAAAGIHVALIAYLDPPTAGALRAVQFPALAVSLTALLGQMRDRSFAEVVRGLRNQSVHGVPSS
jgi:hypothetical protein